MTQEVIDANRRIEPIFSSTDVQKVSALVESRAERLNTPYLVKRLRRNRQTQALRDLTQETRLHPSQMIAPLFVMEGRGERSAIKSMPGIERLCIDLMLKEAKCLYQMGVRAVDIFCLTPQEKKDPMGSEALRSGNLLQQAISALKGQLPEMCVMADIALDPYTDHGHDGIVDRHGDVINDVTLEALALMSLRAAEAGADLIAPSDMMDGRVAHIRRKLDAEGFQKVGILSYAAKYASSFYGPFRDALESAPKFGNKKTYQLNPANSKEALLEVALDEAEGADMLLVKPALPYLDIIAKIKERTHLPVGAYHVSGEYAMIKAASEKGWINGELAMYESLISIKRAGADFIFTYAAKEVIAYMQRERLLG